MDMNKISAEQNENVVVNIPLATPSHRNQSKLVEVVGDMDPHNDTITWSQISEPDYVSDDEEKKRDAQPKGWCTKKKIKCYIILAVIVVVIIGIILLWNTVSKAFFDWLLKTVEDLATSETVGAYAFFIGFQFAFSWFVLPGLAYFNILQGFFMKNFVKAWLIATFGSWFAAVILFNVIRCFFKKRLEKKFKDNSFYRVLKAEVKANPWKTGTFINILFIPTAFKNYTIPLTDLTLVQYVVPSLPFYAFFSGMLSLIGHQLGSIEELSNTNFSEMTAAQKINFIVPWIFIVLTFVIVFCFGRIARKKMLELNIRERKIRSGKKKLMIRVKKYEKAMMDRKYAPKKIEMKLQVVRPKKEEGDEESK